MSPEDVVMFLSQVSCAKCHHRFTNKEDYEVHEFIIHQGQPTPQDMMSMLELILTTVSRDYN